MRTALFLGFLVLLAVPDDSPAGWGPGGCSPVGGFVRMPLAKLPTEQPAKRYVWEKAGDGDLHRLYDHGVLAATYRFSTDEFRWADGRLDTPPWGAREKSEKSPSAATDPFAPTAAPFFTPEARPVAVIPNFGVDLAKIGQNSPRYAINGRPATLAEAKAAVEGSTLRDDSQKLRLTVIGPETERQQTVKDLASHPALTNWKDSLVVKDYPPEHWAVARAGFVTAGKPTIYLQKPDGTVLHRQDDYNGGAEQLAEALRKADPNYQPAKDPDKRKPALPSLPELPDVPLWLWISGGAVALLLLGKPPVEAMG